MLAFGVGAGRAPPQPVLGASTPLAWNTVVLRTLYLVGLLVGVGVVGFWLLARDILGTRAATADRPPPLLRDAGGVPGRERHRPRRGLGHALRARAPHRRHPVARGRSGRRARAGVPAHARGRRRARIRADRGADALGARPRPDTAAPPRGAGRPRAHTLGRRLVRRARRARLRLATRDPGRRRTQHDRRAVLDRRARIRVRARRQRPRPGTDRARRRDRDLVDVVRPRADRQDGALRAVARARLAQPLAAPRQLRPPAPLGGARDGAAARDRGGRRRADGAPSRRRGERVAERRRLRPAPGSAAGDAAAARRRGRRPATRIARGRGGTHAGPRDRDDPRPGRHRRRRPERPCRRASSDAVREWLLHHARLGPPRRPHPGRRRIDHDPRAGGRAGCDRTACADHARGARVEVDRLRRDALIESAQRDARRGSRRSRRTGSPT